MFAYYDVKISGWSENFFSLGVKGLFGTADIPPHPLAESVAFSDCIIVLVFRNCWAGILSHPVCRHRHAKRTLQAHRWKTFHFLHSIVIFSKNRKIRASWAMSLRAIFHKRRVWDVRYPSFFTSNDKLQNLLLRPKRCILIKSVVALLVRPGQLLSEKQGYGSGSAFLKNWILIRIRVKSFLGLKWAAEGRGRSQWRPGGSKWSLRGSIDHWLQIPITLKRSWIRIRIKVNCRIRKSWSRSTLKWWGSATLPKNLRSQDETKKKQSSFLHAN